MKHIFLSLVSICLIFGTISCSHSSKSYPVTGDYMIIGHPGGFVADPIVSYYLINNGKLTKDATVNMTAIPTVLTGFNFSTACPTSKYDLVKNLLTSIPSELLTKNKQRIGELMPDAGYTDIRVFINGVSYQWYFEAIQTSSSAEVRQFVATAEQLFN